MATPNDYLSSGSEQLQAFSPQMATPNDYLAYGSTGNPGGKDGWILFTNQNGQRYWLDQDTVEIHWEVPNRESPEQSTDLHSTNLFTRAGVSLDGSTAKRLYPKSDSASNIG
ncbi:MAG: hypothetical protein Q9186_004147 [Xanthomendoza sp. 1 TL-2023]